MPTRSLHAWVERNAPLGAMCAPYGVKGSPQFKGLAVAATGGWRGGSCAWPSVVGSARSGGEGLLPPSWR